MSNEVKRYTIDEAGWHLTDGQLLVRADDYAALEAECERWRGLFEESEQHLHHWQRQAAANGRSTKAMEQERDALRAQLEAIRAAGGEAVEVVAWMLADAVGGSMLEFQRELLLQDQCRHGGELVPLCDQRIVAAMAAELEKARKGFPAMVEYVEEIANLRASNSELRAELEAARKQEPVARVGMVPGTEFKSVDFFPDLQSLPVGVTLYMLPTLAGKVSKRDASRAAIEKLRAMSHDELLAEVEALLATPSIEVKS